MTNNERPAYPTNGRMHSEMIGITKREYFAGLAMQGLISSMTDKGFFDHNSTEIIATVSIKTADELLKQLEESK